MGSQLLAALTQRGHRIRALAPTTSSGSSCEDAVNSNFEVTFFTVEGFDSYANRPYFGQPGPAEYRLKEGEQIRQKLLRIVTEDRPDIILIGREAYVWHVPEVSKSFKIPSALLVHGSDSAAILRGTYPRETTGPFIEQCGKVDVIITMATHWGNSLRRLGFRNVVAIPNPVDLQLFLPGPKPNHLLSSLELSSDDVIVLHASNLQRVKRPLDIVRSARFALEKNPALAYVTLGDGEYREAMEELCRQDGIADRFRFTGWVEYHRMPEYLNLADIVAMPSEHERQSMVYLEAQACGCVLIASDIPAAREVVDDGETGLLFRVGDAEDLAEKTLTAAGDPTLRQDIGRKSRSRVNVNSLERVAARYEGAFSKLMQSWEIEV